MKYPINSKDFNPTLDFHAEVLLQMEKSTIYLQGHAWCGAMESTWLFTNLGKVLCIFLYEIQNTQSPEDNFIWMIAGDFPPMYLDTVNVPNTKEVIGTYVALVNHWIRQVENKQSLEDCYPVLSDQSPASLEILKKRMELLHQMIEPQIANIPVSAYRSS